MTISFNKSNNFFNKPLAKASGLNVETEVAKKEEARLKTESKISRDSRSKAAAGCLEAMVDAYDFTPGQLIGIYEELNSQTNEEDQQNLDIALAKGMVKSFKQVALMDNQSENAIANFRTALDSSLTKDEMAELFVRFSREISVNFPAAWNELEGILANNLSNAKVNNNTMDAQSATAIANFKGSINSSMTKDDMIELFIRCGRQISIKFPAAWNELSGMLANSLAMAYAPNTSMDNQSATAISNFRNSINTSMSRDEMVELFVRFSREVSANFPAAWNELSAILDNQVSSAFQADTSMDNQSKYAIANFKSTINSSMTKDQMVELFIRFSREISVNYPQAWKQLESTLSQEVPNAFKPITTIDNNSKALVEEFINRVEIEELSTSELEELFGNYAKQISLKFVDAKKNIETAYQKNINKAEDLDKIENNEVKSSSGIIQNFRNLVQDVNSLDNKVQTLGFELSNSEDKDEISKKLAEINKIESTKQGYDSTYQHFLNKINENKVVQANVSDDYRANLNVSKARPNDKKLQQKEMKQLTRWDMLRTMRRKEVLGELGKQKKDTLVEQLTSVPKFILKKILLNQTHEQQCEILMTQRYPEALLRDIPESNAKKQLPKAEDMLPVLMMTGRLSNGQSGMELIRGIVVGDFKAQKAENQTRAREEIVPFVADLLLNKPPKAAEALKSSAKIKAPNMNLNKDIKTLAKGDNDLVSMFLGQENQEPKAGRRDRKVDMSKENKNRLPRLDLLSPGQLLELAKNKVEELSDDEAKDTFRAKRGSGKEICEFLDSLDSVSSLAGAKLAVATLYNHQQMTLKQAAANLMNEEDMVKVTLGFGKDKESMVKEMPTYTIQNQIKSLPKVKMIDSFKELSKDQIIGAFKQLPSQTIASIAFDAIDREEVSQKLLNNKGFAAS